MEIVHGEAELRERIRSWRREELRIGFVPTMGALHQGHLSLVGRARQLADRVAASVFVNPTQFAPWEDLDSYPREPEGDAALLEAEGCHLLFLPATSTIYSEGHCTRVVIEGPARSFEADQRAGHFEGVATVVSQLFNLVQPDVAIFGQKDAQQAAVVRRLVRDLHFPVEIEVAPTVREADGLALSSRNTYLKPAQRRAATVLHRALRRAEALAGGGTRDAEALVAAVRDEVKNEPLARLDYTALVDADTFAPVEELEAPAVLALAARFGSTRLLDNILLEPGNRPSPCEGNAP